MELLQASVKRYKFRWRDVYRDYNTLDLNDEENILDVEQRTGTRAVVVTAERVYLCGAEKGDGDPCEREVETSAETCFQHD